jgi:hypothetical protein
MHIDAAALQLRQIIDFIQEYSTKRAQLPLNQGLGKGPQLDSALIIVN